MTLNELGLMVRIDEEGRIYPYSEKATTVLDIFLKQINDYCQKISTDQNKACMSGITNFLKRKIKRIFK